MAMFMCFTTIFFGVFVTITGTMKMRKLFAVRWTTTSGYHLQLHLVLFLMREFRKFGGDINGVNCTGTESSLADCAFDTVKPLDCPYYKDAGVFCSNDSYEYYLAQHNRPELPVRLSGGTKYYEGRVEVYSDGHWWAICADRNSSSDSHIQAWPNIEAANIICQELEFAYASLDIRAELLFDSDPESMDFLLSDVRCNGTEKQLSECQYMVLSAPYKCNRSMDQYPAVVSCRGILPLPYQPPYEGKVVCLNASIGCYQHHINVTDLWIGTLLWSAVEASCLYLINHHMKVRLFV
ncbi:lysyl oxidase homolog 2-like isoform X1 [Amphiura filiformis]|uniref:lysyl oxidase homolog 2-like isoform X1 n=1 Tax=Amphiura filiformis TaxID=82378 RepID=UPI003B210112